MARRFEAEMDLYDKKEYKFDFAPKTNGRVGATSNLLEEDETITSYEVDVAADLTKDSDSATDSSTSVTVWLLATAHGSHDVECKIVTSEGRKIKKTGIVFVRNL